MFRFRILLSVLLLAGAAVARAEDDLWSAVILATNAPKPKAAPAALRNFAPQLTRVFGYNQFEFVGSDSKKIGDRVETRLMPTKTLWMAVKARRSTSKEARGGYLLDLKLYRDERPLVDTEARLAPGSPMFIRGPQYGNGQIIVVLQIQ